MGRRALVLRDDRGEYAVSVEDGRVTIDDRAIPATAGAGGIVHVGDRPRRTAWVAASGDARWVFLDGSVYTFEAARPGARRRGAAHHATLAAPMPATVIRIQARPGDAVARGDVLIVLEAMKMELPVRASSDGVVSAVQCRVGDLVQPGVTLIEIDDVKPEAEG